MDKGNPKSADATIARASHVFVADKLSNLNKKQLTSRKIKWVELRSENGYRKFKNILDELMIPNSEFSGDFEARLNEIFDEIFSQT